MYQELEQGQHGLHCGCEAASINDLAEYVDVCVRAVGITSYKIFVL